MSMNRQRRTKPKPSVKGHPDDVRLNRVAMAKLLCAEGGFYDDHLVQRHVMDNVVRDPSFAKHVMNANVGPGAGVRPLRL